MTLWRAEQSVGVGITPETLVFAVPIELSAERVGDIADDAHVRGVVARFDVHARFPASSDGPNPVLDVIHVLATSIPACGYVSGDRSAQWMPPSKSLLNAPISKSLGWPKVVKNTRLPL